MWALLVNHPRALLFRGGDLVQLRQTAPALHALGVETGEAFDAEPDARGYDVAHVFNLRHHQVAAGQIQAIRRAGVPVLLSPIYMEPSLTQWANRAIDKVFANPGSPGQLEHNLEQLARRTLRVQAPNGATWSAHTRNRPFAGYDEAQAEVLRDIDWLLPNSYLEVDRLVKSLGPFPGPFTIVPLAVDPQMFLDPDPQPFIQKHSLTDFVLQVGRIEGSKNQLLLCYALRELGLPLVLIGSCRQPSYLEAGRRYGPPNLTVIDHLPPEELRSAYAAARVHALPSWFETCGLVTMEAALASCSVVASTAGYEIEYWRDQAYYCDPADYRSIARAVKGAFENHPHEEERRQRLRERILAEYTWERAARLCLDAYEQTLARRRRAVHSLAPAPTVAATSKQPEGLALWLTPGDIDELEPGQPGVTPTAAFLDAYLRHGAARALVAVVPDQDAIATLEDIGKAHPGVVANRRRCRIIGRPVFHRDFLHTPPARVLHLQGPLEPGLAWARHASCPHGFALSGTVRTTSSVAAAQAFAQLLTAPLEPYDTLICPSEAARQAVTAVTDAFAAFLAERHGGAPAVRIRLAVIPPGIDTQRFRPATAEQRARLRLALKVADDEVVVLSAGRLSFHAAANPYPMYHGLYQAVRATGKKVRLLLVDSAAASEPIRRAFLDGARVYAPTITTTLVDASRDGMPAAFWHVADLFTTMPDSVQGSPTGPILEAMASGLPVIASDWAGARELVAADETGVLVPTALVRGAASDLPGRLLVGELNEDAFLAAASQAVVVDCAAAALAYSRLVGNPALCRQMGEAGRRRVLEYFSWDKVIPAYDALWEEQQRERTSWAARLGPCVNGAGPACYPVTERRFAAFAARSAGDGDLVQAVPEHETRLHRLLQVAMTSYDAHHRSTDPVALRKVLDAAAAPTPLGDLDAVLAQAGAARQTARATLAWMLKYALLSVVPGSDGEA